MGLITATFFECGVRYERTTEEGTTKKVNELYIVDALTFTEAESRITEEMQPFVSGDFDVMTLKRTRYSEYDNSEGDKYYKAKIMFITLDEKTGKEKRTAVYWLVPANDIGEARKKRLLTHLQTQLLTTRLPHSTRPSILMCSCTTLTIQPKRQTNGNVARTDARACQ